MASYFLSDIHLRAYKDPRSKILCNYLDAISSKAEKVFFLGDIFDFWMGGHDIWLKRYPEFVSAVKRLANKNIEIYFFEGNHDIHIDPYFAKIGVKIFTEPQVFELYGKKIRIEHGDLFNPDDKPYFFLRSFLRSWPLRAAALLAPGAVTAWVADKGTQASHKRTSVSGRKPEVIEDIKRRTKIYAQKCAAESDFDMLIMGHTHVREDYSFQLHKKTIRFVNLGSWFESVPQAFVMSENSQQFEKIV